MGTLLQRHRHRCLSVVSCLLLVLVCLLSVLPSPAASAPASSSSSPPPKSRPVPIAIDFGSEFIKVSSVRAGAGSYHIVVDEQAKRKVPAVVSFEGGERHFGNGATQLTMRKPKETYWYALRLLGKNGSAVEVEELRRQGWPYELVEMDGRGGALGFRHAGFDSETVVYSVEEVIAMSLEHIVRISEADAETFLSGAVITVPPFFSQSERQAVLDAADLAGLNLYALLNENTAAAIQYGIDRKYDNETQPHTVLLYNMGASSTKVSIVTFSARQVRDGSRRNRTEGGLEVLSVGYDERLGGQYFESVLTERIADSANEQLRAKGRAQPADDVRSNARAFAKIRSAAEKAKMVLSANQETHVHLPSLLHDTDVKLRITRDEFYSWSAPLLERVAAPITAALRDANLSAADLQAVAIIGGGVRIPAVQAAIKQATGVSALVQSLNGDEAMAMGAEFKAIELSKQFKTRPFTVEDVTPYGVAVRIENLEEEESEAGQERWSKAAGLFRRYNRLSKKKTVTFSHERDFSCSLAYDEQSVPHLPSSIAAPLLVYNVTGLTAAGNNSRYARLMEDGQRPRVSVVFLLDQSGLVSLTSAEATLDETVEVPVVKRIKKVKQVEEAADTTDATAADATDAAAEGDTAQEAASAQGETTDETAAQTASEDEGAGNGEAADATAEDGSGASAVVNSTSAAVEDEYEEVTEYKTKKTTHRIPLSISSSAPPFTVRSMSFQDKKEARARLAALRAADELKKAIAVARNNLESFIYNTRAELNDGHWDEVSTDSQREELLGALSAAEDWLYEQHDHSPEPFVHKLSELQQLSEPIKLRLTELTDLPKAIGASLNIFNLSRTQLADFPSSRPWLRPADLEQLANLTASGEAWLQQQMEEQSALQKHEPPVLTSALIYQRLMPIADLSSQLIKIRKPAEKPKPKPPRTAGRKNRTAAANDTDGTEAAEPDTEAEAAAGGGASGEAQRGEADSANGGVETEVTDESETRAPPGTEETRPGYDEL